MLTNMSTSEAAGWLSWIGGILTDTSHVGLVCVTKITIGGGEMTGITQAVSIKAILLQSTLTSGLLVMLTMFFFRLSYSSSATHTHPTQTSSFFLTKPQDSYTATTPSTPSTSITPGLVFPIPFSYQSSILTYVSSWSLPASSSTIFPFPLAIPLTFTRQTTLSSPITPNWFFIPSKPALVHPTNQSSQPSARGTSQPPPPLIPPSITKVRSRSCSPPSNPGPTQVPPISLSKAAPPSSSSKLPSSHKPPAQSSNPREEAGTVDTASPPSATASASIDGFKLQVQHQTSELQLTGSALGLTMKQTISSPSRRVPPQMGPIIARRWRSSQEKAYQAPSAYPSLRPSSLRVTLPNQLLQI
ncbi:hypothetical protein PGT21_033491 [Puccinia graminis f. sp. tritici]|uniref:Uncharacterized protein n=1 Tax=Puccinia graminis f. sp. tritici TaxID=56615 RepID=A0A5B0MZM1_PUCGR|nr:hypothetical protein PGT21_033491 [Puccinia graminis f. sp. tritici]